MHRGLEPGTTNGDGTIAILGAGALGRLWAACLPSETAGFVPKNGAAPSPRALAYRFTDDLGRKQTVRRPWLTDLSELSLLLVTTKAGDTLQALEKIAGQLPVACPIALFQNGLGSQQAVASRWPQRPVLAASTTEAANRPGPDAVVHAARGCTWIGALNRPAQALVEPVAQQLATSGLSIQVEDRILARLWHKLVVNAGINPFTALLDCPNGDILNARLFQDHIDDLCQELAALMSAEGLPHQTPRQLRADIEQVARATATNTSSMRSDVRNGRMTEIDYINGHVVTRSRALGLPAPVNQMLTERVKQLVPHTDQKTGASSHG